MSNDTSIGLLFDMDGVIIDNHRYHFLSWKKTLANYDLEINEEIYREKMNGRTFSSIVNTVFKKTMTSEEGRRIAKEKESIYRDLYRAHLRPTSGLIDFLKTINALHIPMAVGTSAPKENVTFTLDGLKIRKYFHAVLDDRSVSKGKPDPEIYLKCASAIQRKPENCIVFEDAVSGINAGKAAGAKVIALATSHKREELNASLVVDDFRQVDLDVIKKVLG